jgi:hypothetical protein
MHARLGLERDDSAVPLGHGVFEHLARARTVGGRFAPRLPAQL